MEYEGTRVQMHGARPPPAVTEGSSSLDEEAMWQMNLRGSESMESGPYPERPGEPDCAYYIRTGLCRFGMTCKFNHPPNRKLAIAAARIKGGYPERVGQPECQYYLKTGTCKFGATCKFHHPKDKAGIAGRVQLNILGYPLRPGQMGSSSPDSQQQTPGAGQYYGTSRQSETGAGAQGTFSSYRPGSIPMGVYALQRENIFPERPDQPECQFYMKTGDCKFGAVCKFHHPRERLVPVPNCSLSPLGLPLRPGEPLCVFYARYGICKFGPNCKFDHPMGTFTYGISTSSTADAPRRLIGSSSGPPALTSSSEGPADAGISSRDSRRLSLSESRQIGSGDETMEAEASHTSSSMGQVSSFS
ncbi:zinc finger CCCH domain-containing protein ZFN-like isoform X3 [Phoenix dactylifera]|uniref:Zinc finger CCCH domain-containing protein ZFN-like isoform X3 n=1 Tax=Phoenix dactylifera TaxID=42345 RepID=A0A8B8ZG93_PHODC|nr:zinc finger CCCH domain-containing protein ZFN-like isoform X3 [Phoenix dactylifera]